MTKNEFLRKLQDALLAGGYTDEEAQASCDFYAEVIADRQENGMEEREAVEKFGDIFEIAAQILAEQPPKEASAEPKATKAEPSTAMKVLFWCSVPFWVIPFAILIALLASFLACAIAFFVCGAILPILTGACAIGAVVISPFLFTQNVATAVAFLGCALVLCGFTLLIVRPIFYYCVFLWRTVCITFRTIGTAFRHRLNGKEQGGTDDEKIK